MAKMVLTVDDSASIRQMVAFTLKSAGYEVIEAADGNAGLAQAKSNAVSLVLTDQNMPGMDGLSLIKALRALPNYKSTPILMPPAIPLCPSTFIDSTCNARSF